MNLKTTRERVNNPLLVDLLKKLTEIFNSMNLEFFVIGAIARDLVAHQLIGYTAERKTRDLDIAILISNWRAFDEIKERLIIDGFRKSQHQHQRFYYDTYELDVVPCGIEKEDDNIYWPPEEEIAIKCNYFEHRRRY